MEPDYATCGMTTWVGSFDPLMFIYFMLATVLIPYPTYVIVATIFNWEHRKKRPARHYQDLMQATSYGVIVFIFGNYAQTLKYVSMHIANVLCQLFFLDCFSVGTDQAKLLALTLSASIVGSQSLPSGSLGQAIR